jgi:hypothetical protein
MIKKQAKKKDRKGHSRKSSSRREQVFTDVKQFKQHFYPKTSASEEKGKTNDKNFGSDLALASLNRHAIQL